MIYLIFWISILIHEFCHIVVAVFLGYRIKNINILPFGTCVKFKKITNNILKNIIINIAGPCSNFFICVIFYKNSFYYSEEIFYSNMLLGIFNLLPILPLDGSKIINNLLNIKFSFKKSNIYTYRISKTILCIITFLYSILIIKIKNISFLIILTYLWYIDFKENNDRKILEKAYKVIEKSYI